MERSNNIKEDPEERAVLQKFRECVSDLNQNDEVLIRYLRARSLDIPGAEAMLRSAVQWREDAGLKNKEEWQFPPNYSDDLAYEFFGEDNDGSTICWIFAGKWTANVLIDNGEEETVIRWIYLIMEHGLKLTQESGSPGHIIVDLEGLSFTQATHVQSLKLVYQGLLDFELAYPEIIKSLMIINAPWIFHSAFNFIKGAIAPKTLEKMRIFGSNKVEWYTELLEILPKDSISSKLVIP